MTKDKTPEVGDVWETDLHICYVIRVKNDIVETIIRDKPYYDGIKYHAVTCSDNFFKALWKFKYKSKISPDDLFKTEEEE